MKSKKQLVCLKTSILVSTVFVIIFRVLSYLSSVKNTDRVLAFDALSLLCMIITWILGALYYHNKTGRPEAGSLIPDETDE